MSLQTNPKIQEAIRYAKLDEVKHYFDGNIRFYSYDDARWFHKECDDCGVNVKCNNFISGGKSGLFWDIPQIVFEFSEI
jgi:hypothetical protein